MNSKLFLTSTGILPHNAITIVVISCLVRTGRPPPKKEQKFFILPINFSGLRRGVYRRLQDRGSDSELRAVEHDLLCV